MDDDVKAADAARAVREALNADPDRKHATFVVGVLPLDPEGGYAKTREKLHALNRWQQMQAPSIAVPSLSPHGGKPVCEVDLARPSLPEPKPVKGENRFVSESVSRRRKFGQEQKQRFYSDRTGIKGVQFTNDLDELSSDESKGNLHHKIALIYLDGNGFGALARKYCTDANKQAAFDQKIRRKYQEKEALTQLLTEIKDGPNWKNGEKIRLETLLWGGDEIIWVVPAWKGWWMLGRFFEISGNWTYEGQKLTHAAGLVFCHHNAPIHRIKRLAQTLGDQAKTDRTRNRVAYQVLESFDHAGTDVEDFRKRRCPGPVEPGDLLLDGNAMLGLFEPMHQLKERLPKRQVHKIVQSLYDGGTETPGLVDKAGKQDTAVAEALDLLGTCFGTRYARWLHVLELWDYIDPTHGKKEANADAAG